MRPTPLQSTGLGISQDEITSLFAPFVERTLGANDPAWRKEIGARRLGILRKLFKQFVLRRSGGRRRDKETVLREYSQAWRPSGYDDYRLGGALARVSPWEYLGQNMFASDVGGTRVRQMLLIRMIEKTKPRSVMEVGCGNGINLLLLAGRFPDIAFTGCELTQEGHQSALMFQEQDTLPEAMQQFAPLPIEDPTAFKRIRFIQGDAANLPFEENAFDLVYTVLALEQMERIRRQALGEIARVAHRHTLMIEPFQDVNKAGWSRAYVIRRDYFRGRIEDLDEYGLHPMIATDDFPQEVFLKVCAVLSEKRQPHS